MPVITRNEHKKLADELQRRMDVLQHSFTERPLKGSQEGCANRRYWKNVDAMCATTGSTSELRVAVDDFKTILAEIRRLK
jgi:hypothetical protein